MERTDNNQMERVFMGQIDQAEVVAGVPDMAQAPNVQSIWVS